MARDHIALHRCRGSIHNVRRSLCRRGRRRFRRRRYGTARSLPLRAGNSRSRPALLHRTSEADADLRRYRSRARGRRRGRNRARRGVHRGQGIRLFLIGVRGVRLPRKRRVRRGVFGGRAHRRHAVRGRRKRVRRRETDRERRCRRSVRRRVGHSLPLRQIRRSERRSVRSPFRVRFPSPRRRGPHRLLLGRRAPRRVHRRRRTVGRRIAIPLGRRVHRARRLRRRRLVRARRRQRTGRRRDHIYARKRFYQYENVFSNLV